MKRDISLFSKLFKFKWSITIVFVLIGALVGSQFNLSSINIPKLLATLIFFQLWYVAIYVIADILDHNADLKDHIKSKRPLPAGLISRSQAFKYALVIFAVAGTVSYLLDPKLLLFELAFLAYNLLYTKLLKHITYVDSYVNAATTAARVYMGMLLFGGYISWPIILSCYLFAVSICIGKRLREKRRNQIGRRTSTRYSFLTSTILYIWNTTIVLLVTVFGSYPYKIISITTLSVQVILMFWFYTKKKNLQVYFNTLTKLYD